MKFSKTNGTHLMTAGLIIGGAMTAMIAQGALAETDTQGAGPQGRGQRPEMHGPMMDFAENVVRSVENIENGVVITLTTTDADTLEKIHNMPEKEPGEGPFGDAVERTVTELENGVKIQLTSTDAEVVEKLQNMPEEGPMGHGRHGGPEMMENVDRSVENIENGVIITLTSDDAETVKILQEHEAERPE